jgi:dTDP-4-amino-4,6-dideoxygalactose transaminase
MTTGGEGGMVTTNEESLWKKMWAYKDHGKSWDAIYNKEHPPGFRWLHESFGTNWRLTEMQSAIGRIQLKRMCEWKKKRNDNAALIEKELSKHHCIRLVEVPENIQHAQYKFYAFIKSDFLIEEWSRDRIVDEINALGVPCFQGSCSEVYLEKAFDNSEFRPEKSLPSAKDLGETSLMFLVHPTLTSKEMAKTCQVIDNVLSQATK